MSDPEPRDNDNIVDFTVRRPARGPLPAQQVARLLTFRNIVGALGVATFLIFLGSAVSARIAFLFAALLGLLSLILFEMASRRAWEADMTRTLQRLAADYERLVRDAARNRNDMLLLRRSLADAGAAARSQGEPQGGKPAADPGARMMRALAAQLSRLGGAPEAGAETAPPETPLLADGASLRAATQETVARLVTDAQVLQLVAAAVRQDRVDLFLQPIVALPQRKPRFYEMFSRIRIRDEVYLPAERFVRLARAQEFLPAIDNLLLLRGLQLIGGADDAADGDSGAAFFCNITSLTLNDPKFMADLAEFLAGSRTLASRLVFEFGQRDLAAMSPDVLPVLEGLSRLGCRFSMDQVRSMSLDFAHLEARHVRFVKADAALLFSELGETGGLARLRRLKAEMDANGIDLVATRVETERQLVELLDLGIDYGQGFLFGHPQPAHAAAPGG